MMVKAHALRLALRGRHLLLIDAALVALAYVASLALRFDAPSVLFEEYLRAYSWVLPVLLVARMCTFVAFGLYQRVWRFASVAELQAIILAVLVSSALAYGAVYALGLVDPRFAGLPRSIPFIETLLMLGLIGASRLSFLLFRIGRQRTKGGGGAGSRAVIVGAGAAGVAVARQLMSDRPLGLHLVGFIDDHEVKGHRLLGLPVLGTVAQLQEVVRSRGIGTVLFALPSADGPTLRRLVRVAEREGARSLTVPSISEVVAGQVSSALREVQVDDLLRRVPARIDLDSVRGSLNRRTVLVTGAGGSIGSELVRQILTYEPSYLVLLGRGENSIYEVIEAVRDRANSTELVPAIMDVRDEVATSRLLRETRPEVVFHAAAHKHVSLMELYPDQAVAANVFGTANLLNAAIDADVPSFVFVSTDKAVRPTSVMGATKRMGELLVRDAARRSGKRYVTVRFGNVLSSRGSVVLRFRRQLAEGGPLTVSHPQVRRYFMTVSEAVQLILQAMVLGRGGETFVLDMGEPVLIEDLARDLIELHGMIPGRDIRIVYTGLQPGEKMSEELFLPDERPRRTVHENIWSAEDPRSEVLAPAALSNVRDAVRTADRMAIVGALRHLIPEFEPSAPPRIPSTLIDR